MIFLPIADRELRVASRNRWTFWTRIAAAIVALLIGCAFFVLTTIASFGFGTPTLGSGLFAVLTWLSLAAALATGLFFTADCLSEEKREGTLGLLFLTDLRGYDVVLGKLLATSWQGLLALVASFPILAVTLLMGGVTGVEFWQTSLAILNAMFLSLAIGLFVSALSRDSQKALAVTLGFLILLAAGGPAIDATYAELQEQPFDPVASFSSPVYLFVAAGGWGRNPFWTSLLVNQVIVWTLFSAACLLAPRTWQDKVRDKNRSGTPWTRRSRFGGATRRTSIRRRLLELDPVVWLTSRERWQTALLWIVALILVSGWIAAFAPDARRGAWFAWSYLGGGFTLILYLGIASHAGRFLVDARRSGLIELLLATPLTVAQLIQGQWRSMLRRFTAPLTLWLMAQLIGTVLVQHLTWSQMAAATAAIPTTTSPAAGTNTPTSATNAVLITTNTATFTTATSGGVSITVSGAGTFNPPGYWLPVCVALAGTVTVIANLIALVWFGMWMGLTSKNASLSTLKTLLFVQVIPWLVISFASAIAFPLLMLPSLMKGTTPNFNPARIMIWYPLITTAISTSLSLVKDLAFSFWARRKLYSEFRERALPTLPSLRRVSPPPLPRPPALNQATTRRSI